MEPAQRGKYPRASTRIQRAQRERASLISAASAALLELAEHELTVSELCQRAGVGRNTLYLHWPSVSALISEVIQEAEARLRSALILEVEELRTPRNRLTALSTHWLQFAGDSPQFAGLLLGTRSGRTALGRVLGYELSQLGRQAYASGLSSRVPSEDALSAVSGAFVALGERALRGRLSLDLAELSGILTHLSLGALR
jgi:AcrR family transcriptional regulator